MTTKGRGRPPVGPAVKVRLPADLLAFYDEVADEYGITRASMLRHVLEVAAASAESHGWDRLRPSAAERPTAP